ncbi:uncharacterized protein LOC141601530 [Silene latifolia]|uniref:uncharacterized protein LOC141601530 n=1 Tax=Silene latifolia TaxID=37657 RepID=UPI003D770C3C
MNNVNKQRTIIKFLNNQDIGLFALIETKIKVKNADRVIANFSQDWSITTNSNKHKGGRIWVIWKPAKFHLAVRDCKAQCIHIEAISLINNAKFFITFVYAFNSIVGREELWKDLKLYANHINGPWAMGGDFNCVTQSGERLGTSTSEAEMNPFIECINECGMMDIQSTGAYYTWSNKQQPIDRVYSRLDRFMVNQNWVVAHPHLFANFLPEGVFDHCPCMVRDSQQEETRKKSFKYLNMWGEDKNFVQLITDAWQTDIAGHRMYTIVRKLKLIKPVLKQLNKDSYSDIEGLCNEAERRLEKVQQDLIGNMGDKDLMNQEYEANQQVQFLQKAKFSFLQQQAKAAWLCEGDANTALFHRVIKTRRAKNAVFQIEDRHGSKCTDQKSIQEAFLEYYGSLLGMSHGTVKVSSRVIKTGRICDQAH